METSVMFLDCPAYLDNEGSVRCGLPAEVEYRYLANSSDGPLESAKIRCPLGHWFNAPIEYLTWKKTPDAVRTDSGGKTERIIPALQPGNPGIRRL